MELELEYAPGIIDKMSTFEFVKLFTECFPGRRSTELIGWAFLFAVAGINNGPKLRHALEQAGYSESAFYRALADFRKFGEFVEKKYHAKMTVEQIVEKIRVGV